NEIMEKDEVKQVIVQMVNAIDKKEWGAAVHAFEQEVLVDYSSLSGQPGKKVKAAALVGGWEKQLSNVRTHHMLGNFDITIDGGNADVWSHVYASHVSGKAGYWDAFGRYHHILKKRNGEWKISKMTLIMHGQKGNLDFLSEVSSASAERKEDNGELVRKKVRFPSGEDEIVGTLFVPHKLDAKKKHPAIIVSGSWTTVKEQMAGHYAEHLAHNGFIALAFDFRNFGESGGKPRFYECPTCKIEDIQSAVSYLESVPVVNGNRIGALGICAGSMYTLMAAAEDERIRSVVTVASWLHDAEAVKLFYGGAEGVNAKIAAAKAAKVKYDKTGEVEYIPSISTTDKSAAMYGPYDYYLNPNRGAIKQWSADSFAVMSWEGWLTLDPMPSAGKLEAPTLMIHSNGAVLPAYTKRYFKNIATNDKELHWIETDLESPSHQFSFYDGAPEVEESIKLACEWFAEKM
ncbi:MAG: alpha/beta fold hydrolase, partial [Chitinivibrionales bacterium]|nr:alpha/beta fold hydrolase [Chitinivibrionales bacterium]